MNMMLSLGFNSLIRVIVNSCALSADLFVVCRRDARNRLPSGVCGGGSSSGALAGRSERRQRLDRSPPSSRTLTCRTATVRRTFEYQCRKRRSFAPAPATAVRAASFAIAAFCLFANTFTGCDTLQTLLYSISADITGWNVCMYSLFPCFKSKSKPIIRIREEGFLSMKQTYLIPSEQDSLYY